MELKTLIAECTAYDFKVMLEEKKPKSWLKSVSAFANGLGGSLFFGIDNDGIKALDGYKDELKPVFKSTPTRFQTIIFASSDTPNVGDNVGDVSETKLTERQQKILNLIKESPTITGRQMSETLSVSQRTIERDLSALQKKGVLRHEGKDNDGKWTIYQNTVTNEEIVNGLVSNGVSVVAVTDHDMIAVQMITELRNLGMPKGLHVLPGIEFCSELGGSESVHFIGIFPDNAAPEAHEKGFFC